MKLIEARTDSRDASLPHRTLPWSDGSTVPVAAIALMLFTHNVTAAGDACDARHQFAFLDGAKSCLVDTPFADLQMRALLDGIRVCGNWLPEEASTALPLHLATSNARKSLR